MKIGVLLALDANVEKNFKDTAAAGFHACQLCGWDMSMFTDAWAEKIKAYSKEYDVEITAFWCGWSGPAKWNFTEGPLTLGIVPEVYRTMRVAELKLGSDFAKKLGVTDVITHMGFIPETPFSESYHSLVIAIRELAEYCKKNGQYLLFETGQETPVTLLRTIETVGTGNLGINLDPANLILYGKANPVDALEVFGQYVRGVHAKDGKYPTDGTHLGKEVPVGEGKVNFPAFVKGLHDCGFDGTLTIEREIHGEEQARDIANTKLLLEKLIAAL